MKIKKIKSQGEFCYPATIAAAVKDANFTKNNSPMTLGEINLYLENKENQLQSDLTNVDKLLTYNYSNIPSDYSKYGNYYGYVTTLRDLGITSKAILNTIQLGKKTDSSTTGVYVYIKIAKKVNGAPKIIYKTTNYMSKDVASTYSGDWYNELPLTIIDKDNCVIDPDELLWIYFGGVEDTLTATQWRVFAGTGFKAKLIGGSSIQVGTVGATPCDPYLKLNVTYDKTLEEPISITQGDKILDVENAGWFTLLNHGYGLFLYSGFTDDVCSSELYNSLRYVWTLIPTEGGYYLYNILGWFIKTTSTASTAIKKTKVLSEAEIFTTGIIENGHRFFKGTKSGMMLDNNGSVMVMYGTTDPTSIGNVHNCYHMYKVNVPEKYTKIAKENLKSYGLTLNIKDTSTDYSRVCLYENYVADGSAFVIHQGSTPLNNSTIEVEFDLSTCSTSSENIFGLGSTIDTWHYTPERLFVYKMNGLFKIQLPLNGGSYTHDLTLGDSKIVKLIIAKQYLAVEYNGTTTVFVSDTVGTAAERSYLSNIFTNSTYKIGAAEGGTKSKATYNYIKIKNPDLLNWYNILEMNSRYYIDPDNKIIKIGEHQVSFTVDVDGVLDINFE